MATQLAFIGMGVIGQGITKNLAEKGNLEKPLLLYNRTKSRAAEQSLLIKNSIVAESLQEVVSRSDIIWSSLQNETAVTETFEEFFSLDLRGKLFVESSTIPSDLTRILAQRITNSGAEFIAMPVFGDGSVANAGNLICVPAGPASSVDRIRPYLTGVICKKVIDLSGEDPGKASTLKLIGNVLIVTTIETIAEITVFAEKAGISNHCIQELLEQYTKIAPAIYSEQMSSGSYYQKAPSVDVSKALDLSSHVLELAGSLNMPLKGYQVGLDHMALANSIAGPKCDITSIYGAVRIEGGLPFENRTQEDNES